MPKSTPAEGCCCMQLSHEVCRAQDIPSPCPSPRRRAGAGGQRTGRGWVETDQANEHRGRERQSAEECKHSCPVVRAVYSTLSKRQQRHRCARPCMDSAYDWALAGAGHLATFTGFLYFWLSFANSLFSCGRCGARAVSRGAGGGSTHAHARAHLALPLDQRLVQRAELLRRPVGVVLLQARAVMGVGAVEVGDLDDAQLIEPARA